MNREEKQIIINSLAEKLTEYAHFYITDTSELNAEQTAALRKKCFEQEVKLVVVKNTLFIIPITGSSRFSSRPNSTNIAQIPAKFINISLIISFLVFFSIIILF